MAGSGMFRILAAGASKKKGRRRGLPVRKEIRRRRMVGDLNSKLRQTNRQTNKQTNKEERRNKRKQWGT